MRKNLVGLLSGFILLSLVLCVMPTRIAAVDTTAPTVSATVPINGATDVSINSAVAATFSEAMDPLTISTATFALFQGSTPIAGVVTYVGVTATFTPNATLSPTTIYTALITTGVKDLANNSMVANRMWSFTTGVTPDTTAPMVSSTVPVNALTGVAINSAITATFNEAMDPSTINIATFTLTQGGTGNIVSGQVTYSGLTAVFKPISDLAGATAYTAQITTAVKDLAGNHMSVVKTWYFQTGSGPRTPINLGLASNFAILAKSGIMNTGVETSIIGDIGVSPIAASAITGFDLINSTFNQYATSALVDGKVYAADNAPPTPVSMALTISDMELAYLDAESRILPDYTELGSGDIGGLRLYPGLYKWSSVVSIATDLTIEGSATDVWIFQIAQDLIVSAAKKVILSGGALASNIFWQVAGQTTLGTDSVFNGNILCLTAIVLNTGATLNGRALAQTAVTLQNSTVTIPPSPVVTLPPFDLPVTFPVWAVIVIVVAVAGLVSGLLLIRRTKKRSA